MEEILDDDPGEILKTPAPCRLLRYCLSCCGTSQEDPGRLSQTEGTRKTVKLHAGDVAQVVEHLPSVH